MSGGHGSAGAAPTGLLQVADGPHCRDRCAACGQPVGYWATDKLTGLLDRWGWDDEAVRAIGQAHRRGEPVALLIIDLDLFKRINDLFGHLVGDEVLRAVAGVIRSAVRSTDVAGRYGGHGGDEFLVLLPGTDRITALDVANRIRCGVKALAVTVDGVCGPAVVIDDQTVSVGVSGGADGEGQNLLCLVRAADAALRDAKVGGRDRVSDTPAPFPGVPGRW